MQRRHLLLLLWLLAALLAAVLLWGRQGERQLSIELGNIGEFESANVRAAAVAASVSTVLIEPRFTGRTSKEQLWELQAKRATHTTEHGQKLALLESVYATVEDKNGTPLLIRAENGTFNTKANTLMLEEQVVLNGYGFHLYSPTLFADLKKQKLIAQVGVTLRGSWGDWQGVLTAPKLEANDLNGKIRLTGGVKGRFQPPETQTNVEMETKE